MQRSAIFCLTLSLIGISVVSVRGQEKADPAFIKGIEAAGGQVMEIAQNDPHLTVAFHLSDKEVNDASLACLKGGDLIVELNLRGTAVSDAGLAHIGGLKNLKKLHLEKTKVTDAGLAHLKGLTNLEYLNLYGTEVTDAAVEQLKPLTGLKKVYLWQTKVTDAGQEQLEQLLANAYINRGIDKVNYPLIADKPLEAYLPPADPQAEEKPEEKKPEEKK